jgi:hypothetical protein
MFVPILQRSLLGDHDTVDNCPVVSQQPDDGRMCDSRLNEMAGRVMRHRQMTVFAQHDGVRKSAPIRINKDEIEIVALP